MHDAGTAEDQGEEVHASDSLSQVRVVMPDGLSPLETVWTRAGTIKNTRSGD